MRSRYKKSATLGIPFFSKISLRAVADRIQLMGYGVEIHLVEKVRKQSTPNVMGRAVRIEPSLQGRSPENGNIADGGGGAS
jgi:hypothetical protein